MNKNRLEAFSDGVFAIVITLLILDIRLPNVSYEHLPQAIWDIMPNIGAYALSFVVIGIYWVMHHFYLDDLKKTDGVFLWMNILLLLFISFIPFPTSLIGRYPLKPIPLVVYGLTLIAVNSMGFLMLMYLKRNPHLLLTVYDKKFYKGQYMRSGIINGVYILAVATAFFYPVVSYILFGLIALGLIILNTIRIK